MENNTKIKLISFLRGLAGSLESNQLSKKQAMRVGEFFMAYQFQEVAYKDVEESEQESDDEFDKLDFDVSELRKFICLGWYVYCVILKGKTLES